MKGINWVGVIAAVVVGQVIGFLWYGMLFEEQWMALSGVTPSGDAANTAMALGVVNQLVVAVGLAWLIGKLGNATLAGGATAGLLAGIFFDAIDGLKEREFEPGALRSQARALALLMDRAIGG